MISLIDSDSDRPVKNNLAKFTEAELEYWKEQKRQCAREWEALEPIISNPANWKDNKRSFPQASGHSRIREDFRSNPADNLPPPPPQHGANDDRANDDRPPRETGIKPPELDPIAYHGPIGRIVQLMRPHTEASGPSLLMQSLVSIGNLMGRHACVMGGAREHFTNLYSVTVGESAVGRKGEALAMLKRYVIPTIANHDQKWRARIVSGAASGEGIIYAVRDPVGDDDGADDKRLLLEETEFGGLLTAIDRKDNKLGEILRDAWDGVDLNNMAMKNRDAKTRAFLKATNYHLSLNGHVTKAELREKLPPGAKTANGLANRILWAYSRREKILAHGGKFSADLISVDLKDLSEGIGFASKSGCCRWTTTPKIFMSSFIIRSTNG
jgi:hypothetical protein